ncbi:MAG: hypothetical protein A2X46_08065 [Lentisphaerae bacterium GWF2_57_35]|nr:MAG: hypothetical protein A2X46_08065 [Lentisphaerae bacterium GWF2_57_35]
MVFCLRVLVCTLIFCAPLLARAGGGCLELRDGYFWDAQKESYFIPHGVAYQSWNPPVYANQTFSQFEYDLREMKRMHVNSLRVELTWSQIETNEGCYNFEKADYMMALAEELDMKLFVLMGYQYPPSWFKTNYPACMAYHYDQYLGSTGISDVLNYNSPEAAASYASYVQTIAARYKDFKCVGGWIVGNEFAFYDLWEPPDLYASHRFLGFDTNYSLPSFHRFLSNRYAGVISELNSRWDMTYPDFDAIPMPNQFPLNRQDQHESQRSGYYDVLQWRQRIIAEFLSEGVGAVKTADTNHLVTYAMVGGIFSGFDDNNTCEDAKTIVSVCASNGTPVDFWTINNYPWVLTGNEMRSMDYGVTKYRETIGLPVMLSECGLSDNDALFWETSERQKFALASLPWEAIMSGAIGAHIFHWNDRPEYFSYGNLLSREGGFGMTHGTRLLKETYWNILSAYRRMDEMHIEKLLPHSMDPPNDILAYWSKETDLGYNRYNQEFGMTWAAFRRMGFQLGIIDEDQFDAGVYTNAQALLLPRNFQMEPHRLEALQTNVLAQGVNVLAESDLPGQYDSYYRSNANWHACMASIFGLNVSNAVPGLETGYMYLPTNVYRIYVNVETNCGLLNTNFSYHTWKIWHGITNIDATVLATHTGVTNSQTAIPALTVKAHGNAWASFASFALGDGLSSTGDSPRMEHSWDVRTMMLDAALKQTFKMEPVIELSGDPLARYVVSDYRTCSNGSVLISLLSMNGKDRLITNLVVHAPGLLNGRRVENLTRGGIVTDHAGDDVAVSLAGDEFLLLYAYASDAQSDQSLISTNKGKIWFVNLPWSVPTRVYPTPDWYGVNVGYNIPVSWDWDNVRVALERVGADGSRIRYGVSQSNWVAPGQGSLWTRIPVQPSNLNDSDYRSTLEGGRYVISAWLEDMGEEHVRTEVPVEMFWGVKVEAPPFTLAPNTTYEIPVTWEDVPSYLPEEGPCPLNREHQWPPSEDDVVQQSYRIVLDLLDVHTNLLLTTNWVTRSGSGMHMFSITTPAEMPTNAWWRSLLVAEPITSDLIDSFEDRVPGNIKPSYINDAPMLVWLWDSVDKPYWWDEGIGLEPRTHGRQSQFLYLCTRSYFTYSGHTYHWALDRAEDFSSLALRSNIWFSFDLCIQKTNGTGGLTCPVELAVCTGLDGVTLRPTSYTNNGAFQHFSFRLSQFNTPPSWPKVAAHWNLIDGLSINVSHTLFNMPYVFFLDNVRLTGTLARAGTGGMTNAIYMGNGDLLPSPNPDRPPALYVETEAGVDVPYGAPAQTNFGTDAGLVLKGESRTNRFLLKADAARTVYMGTSWVEGPGQSSFSFGGIPEGPMSHDISSNIAVVFTGAQVGRRDAWLTIPCEGTNFILNLSCRVYDLSARAGPAVGGGLLTLTNLALGGASTVTNVWVGGISAAIVGQGDDWLSIVLPAHEAGWVDIVLQTEGTSELVLDRVYEYKPSGVIGWSGYEPYGWTNLGVGVSGSAHSVVALARTPDGVIYAGGGFYYADGTRVDHITRWNGTAWTNVGSGMNGSVSALLATTGGLLYVGGSFTTAGGKSANYIACWNGSTWTNLGTGLNSYASALALSSNGELYASGGFTTAGGMPATRVAMWNGTVWTNLGSGLNAPVNSLAWGSDGMLYAAGSFTSAGGGAASRVAYWDGAAWHALGSGVNNTVYDIMCGTNGVLAIGGIFTTVSGYAARWTGSAWGGMSVGMNNYVNTLLEHPNGLIYAGGSFTTADSAPAAGMASWNGTNWMGLGSGVRGGSVSALLATGDRELLVGGNFGTAGVVSASGIAKWASAQVVNLGVHPASVMTLGGMNVTIQGLNLGSGSDITNVTLCGISATGILSQCSTQVVVQANAGPAGLGDVVVYSTTYGNTVKSNAFAYYAPRILVLGTNSLIVLPSGEPALPAAGTDFGEVQVGSSATSILFVTNIESNDLHMTGVSTSGAAAARFCISGWPATVAPGETDAFSVVFSPVAGGAQSAVVSLLNDFTNYTVNLAGWGRFDLSVSAGPEAGGNSLIVTNLVLPGGDAITNVVIGGQNAAIQASGENWVEFSVPGHDPGAVDVVVQSVLQGNTLLEDAYTYNPNGTIGRTDYGPYAWTNMMGINSTVYSFTIDPVDGSLYAGSYSGSGVMRWMGTSWTNACPGLSLLNAIASVGGGVLYAGGGFTTGMGFLTDYIACWTGGAWTAMGSGMNASVAALAVDSNGHVYAGGAFTTAGGMPANRVAFWNGAVWTNLGAGLGATVLALALDTNGGLYAAGDFTNAGSQAANRVAYWNGSSWTNLGSGLSSTAYALALGQRGELYVGGSFSFAGGSTVNRLAKWNGTSWSSVGGGMGSTVYALKTAGKDGLYAGGAFYAAGGVVVSCVAYWNGSSWSGLGQGLTKLSSPVVRALEFGPDGQVFAGGDFTQSGLIAMTNSARWSPAWVQYRFGVNPTNGPVEGGAAVVIDGENLGNGTDITNVTFCGAPVASVISQCSTQVVVQTAAGSVGLGDVRVYSAGYGETVKSNAYRYRSSATVYLDNLVQLYNRYPRYVTATTDPSGLNVGFTYNGQTNVPVEAGVYVVTGAVTELDSMGMAASTLIVQRAEQAIAFPTPGNQVVTNTVRLAASADSNFKIDYTIESGPASIEDTTLLSFTQRGYVSIAAAQTGNENWFPAPTITNLFRVYGLYTVSVESCYGSSELSTGAHLLVEETLVTHRVTTPDTRGATQFVSCGWVMTGHDPASGSATEFTMAVTNDAMLAWLWTTNFWLATGAGAQGAVNVPSGWQPAGVTTSIAALADAYCHFVQWTGDVSGSVNPLELWMDSPKSIGASFTANLTTNHGIPEAWLARYGLTNFEADVEADADSDGLFSWQEFRVDTNPTNATSCLRLGQIRTESSAGLIYWQGGTGVLQYLERNEDLEGAWRVICTNAPPTPVDNVVTLGVEAVEGYFRIRVP